MSTVPPTNENTPDWFIYGHDEAPQQLQALLKQGPPPWRDFVNPGRRSYYEYQITNAEKKVINAALYLRRPLLVTGEPGTGKSSLAYSIAAQLGLGKVLVWPITSRATLNDALYRYDAIGRLQAANLARRQQEEAPPIEYFLTLGPLGTAFADSQDRPRVLLIDEIDKSDIDLPNDLLHIFEEGEFEIPELARLAYAERFSSAALQATDNQLVEISKSVRKHDGQSLLDTVPIVNGMVKCKHFPIVILTSNRERELPAPFLRRCLRLHIERPDRARLEGILQAHFRDAIKKPEQQKQIEQFIKQVLEKQETGEYIAPDQLMNATYLVLSNVDLETPIMEQDRHALVNSILSVISKLRM